MSGSTARFLLEFEATGDQEVVNKIPNDRLEGVIRNRNA